MGGCILADGMGLGKTLQAIAVMWTLMEQDVFAGEQTVTNGIVLSPASLVQNWESEIQQWLGTKTGSTMRCFPCLGKPKVVIKQWLSAIKGHNARVTKPVLLISYESFRSNYALICFKGGRKPPKGASEAQISRMKHDIGFVVCDEGHRLKNNKSQLSVAVSLIGSKKRMLLSGTPIQNDLSEMYSLANFVNPGVWSSVRAFRNDACRIVRSFDATANDKKKSAGSSALSAVRGVLDKFLLGRTSKVVMAYLPKKSEYVVFCKLSKFQERLYEKFLNSKLAKEAKKSAGNGEGENGGGGLSAMGFLACGILGKICNHPALIYEACADIEKRKLDRRKWTLVSSASKKPTTRKTKSKKGVSHCTSSEYASDGSRKRTELKGLFALYPPNFVDDFWSAKYASKINFTMTLLQGLRGQRTGDKTVIVSVYTETLDILAVNLERANIPYKRLDGSISTKKRQPIVDEFNDAHSEFLVLLL